MRVNPPTGIAPIGMSPRARDVYTRLAKGTLEIDFERLADALMLDLYDPSDDVPPRLESVPLASDPAIVVADLDDDDDGFGRL